MKNIGVTNNDNVILEASRDEYSKLYQLARLAKGKGFYFPASRMPGDLDDDFADAFEAICEWMEVKDRANALRQMADAIETNTKQKTEETA